MHAMPLNKTVKSISACHFSISLAIAGLVESDNVVVQLGSNRNPQLRRSHQSSSQGAEWLEGSNRSCSDVDKHMVNLLAVNGCSSA